jgi:hypothetical protein
MIAAPASPVTTAAQRLHYASRRWRTPVAIAGIVLLGGVVVALLGRPAATPVNGYLNPVVTSGTGTRALADVLAGRGTRIVPETQPAAAVAAARRGASTIVITSPALLTSRQLSSLGAAPASLVLVAPSPRSLAVLAPGVTALPGVGTLVLQPRCDLAAARLAGSADMGGTPLALAPHVPAIGCYPVGGAATLVQYRSAAGHLVTILGTSAPLENDHLASLGNAALALNLLSYQGRVAWLVPQPPVASGPSQPQSVWGAMPLGSHLLAYELAVAVLLIALWRARRLGPLIAERLPVVVRAAETTEGHGRLYQAHRARGQAAGALRSAVIERLAPALGLPPGAAPDVIAAAVSAHTSQDADRVRQLLYGPAPGSDADLVRLARDLDVIEEEVHAP